MGGHGQKPEPSAASHDGNAPFGFGNQAVKKAYEKGHGQGVADQVDEEINTQDYPDVKPETLPNFACLDDVTVSDPIHHRTAQSRYESDYDTDDGAAQDDEFMTDRIFDTIEPALPDRIGACSRRLSSRFGDHPYG